MRKLLGTYLALLLSLALTIQLAGTPLPVSHLTALPSLDRPIISPNGKLLTLANLVNGQQALTLLDLTTMQPQPLASLGFSRLNNWWWKNDEWLLLLIDNPDGSRDLRAIEIKAPQAKRHPLLTYKGVEILDLLPADPEEVLVALDGRELQRLNVRTSKTRLVEKSLGHFVDWNVNLRGEGIGGIHYKFIEKKILLNYRPAPGAKWESREIGTFDRPNYDFLGSAPDGRRFLVIDRTPEREGQIAYYDATTGQSEAVFTPPGVDPDGVVQWGPLNAPVVAITYETDRRRLHFLDAASAKIQQQIDAALPGSDNLVTSLSQDAMRLVITATSETNPGTYYLLDRSVGRLMKLADRYEKWDPSQMGSSQAFTFGARDGLILRGRLTLPPAGATTAPPPLILLTGQFINGNRARATFSSLIQLLATRGYAVAQIDVRGTFGYGQEFSKRGDLQIATGMAQDLIDGVLWLSAQGKIDSKQVIMFTRSYGGWAGTSALASSSIFSGWVNWATPLESYVNPETIILSNLTRKESISLMGGIFAAERYTEQLAPLRLLPKIDVPSFHWYARNSHDAEFVQKRYRKDPQRHVFCLLDWVDTLAERDATTISSHEQLLAFLGRNFPTDLNPAR